MGTQETTNKDVINLFLHLIANMERGDLDVTKAEYTLDGNASIKVDFHGPVNMALPLPEVIFKDTIVYDIVQSNDLTEFRNKAAKALSGDWIAQGGLQTFYLPEGNLGDWFGWWYGQAVYKFIHIPGDATEEEREKIIEQNKLPK